MVHLPTLQKKNLFARRGGLDLLGMTNEFETEKRERDLLTLSKLLQIGIMLMWALPELPKKAC